MGCGKGQDQARTYSSVVVFTDKGRSFAASGFIHNTRRDTARTDNVCLGFKGRPTNDSLWVGESK